ncbi:MAG TPA: hypothetical protein VIF15_19235, partial [Polyangiaceae bacterium]
MRRTPPLLAAVACAALVSAGCHDKRGGRGGTRGAMHPPAGFTAASIGVGSNHVCAREGDGTVWCWGRDNGYGQLGDGTLDVHGEPRVVAGVSDAIDLAVGFQHACALLRGGEVRCWGGNQDGQLGDGSRRQHASPAAVLALPTARAIFAGPLTTCAEDTGGATWCWGRLPAVGTEPDAWGGSYPEPRPRRVAGLPAGLKTMSVGFSHLCAIPADGLLRCWGSGFLGEMGDGTDRSRTVADLVPGLPAASVTSAGENFSCAIAGGELMCWGFGITSSGAWSASTGCDRSPCKVPSPSGLTALAGSRALCAVDAAGGVECIGSGGVIPSGAPTTWLGPVLAPVPLAVHAIAVSLGPTFGCALGDTGRVACFD